MKRSFEWHGNKYFLLGTGSDGDYYWLQEASFDCGWYWSIGYIETFTNNKAPWRSADIASHSHFKYMMERQKNDFGGPMNWYDAFRAVFHETPLTDSEVWTVIEIMRSLYTARDYSDMLYHGGSYYTRNPVAETIKNAAEYGRINKVVIPALLENLYKILDGTGKEN